MFKMTVVRIRNIGTYNSLFDDDDDRTETKHCFRLYFLGI